MLKLSHISKTFNPGTVNEKVAIRDLSLHLEKGDFATIIGSNGAGKSVGIFSQIPDLLFWMERILHFCHSMPEQKILEDCIRIRCGELLLE